VERNARKSFVQRFKYYELVGDDDQGANLMLKLIYGMFKLVILKKSFSFLAAYMHKSLLFALTAK